MLTEFFLIAAVLLFIAWVITKLTEVAEAAERRRESNRESQSALDRIREDQKS